MANYYTVVHYVPDPVTDEKLNIGVIAFGESEIEVVFLRDWRRAERFADEDIGFLKDFADTITRGKRSQLLLPISGEATLTPELIREIAGSWFNAIQFSEPRASLLSLSDITEDIGGRLLKEHAPKRRRFRDKRVAVRAARTNLHRALDRYVDSPDQYLKSSYFIAGEFDRHEFDLGITNGEALLGVEALSFEGSDDRLRRDIDATAWAIDDVKKVRPGLPLAVVALPPKTSLQAYTQARRIFTGLKADVVEEEEIPDWSQDKVREILQKSSDPLR